MATANPVSNPISQLPPRGQFIESVRTSSRECRTDHKVEIQSQAVDAFLDSLKEEDFNRLSPDHGVSFPVIFSSPLEELNLISVLSLLNILHGYRVALHRCAGAGAFDTIRRLILSMHISSASLPSPTLSPLYAQGMASVTQADIVSYANIKTHHERRHPTLEGITVGEKDDEILEAVELVKNVMNETGEILLKNGHKCLGEFVAEALGEAEKMDKQQAEGNKGADLVVERLVRAFPAFRDMAVIDGKPVYIFKKALFLLQALRSRFDKPGTAPPFYLPPTDDLPIFADNVIPSMLVHFKILDLSNATDEGLRTAFTPNKSSLEGPPETTSALAAARDATTTSVDEETAKPVVRIPGPSLSSYSAYILRASAVDAVRFMVDRAVELGKADPKDKKIKGTEVVFNEVNVDGYLWAVAKDTSQMRKVIRFAEKGTPYY